MLPYLPTFAEKKTPPLPMPTLLIILSVGGGGARKRRAAGHRVYALCFIYESVSYIEVHNINKVTNNPL